MEYRYRVMEPMLPAYTMRAKGYETIVTYSEPKLSKDLWEWLEKDWTQWLDELACRWVKFKGIVTVTKKQLPPERVFSYQEYKVEMCDLVRTIFKYNAEYYCMTGKKIKYILVGQDIHQSLKSQMLPMSFRFPMEMVAGNGVEVFNGCSIVLVPNMKGIVFLPDLPEPLRY